MNKGFENFSGDVTPLALTSLSPRTPVSTGSFSNSEGGVLAEPEDDRPMPGFVRRRVDDVSGISM